MGHCIGYYLPHQQAMVTVGTALEMPPFVPESDDGMMAGIPIEDAKSRFYQSMALQSKMVENIKTKHNTWA